MLENQEDAIQKAVTEIIEDIVQDWGIDLNGGINGKTLLVHDLEFASVDIIHLCVAIEEHYQCKFNFQDLLMQDGSYVSDLSLTQLSQFLSERI